LRAPGKAPLLRGNDRVGGAIRFPNCSHSVERRPSCRAEQDLDGNEIAFRSGAIGLLATLSARGWIEHEPIAVFSNEDQLRTAISIAAGIFGSPVTKSGTSLLRVGGKPLQ
jgi:hypothetical protein